jgi:hypothetical protein
MTRRTLRTIVLALTLAASAASTSAQPEPGTPADESVGRAMRLATAAHNYAIDHDGNFPPDLASLARVDVFDGDGAQATIAERIRKFFVAPGEETRVPDDAGADWINANSSYVYTLPKGLRESDLPAWDYIIVAHLKPDQAHEVPVSEHFPEGEAITAAFLKGYGTAMSRAEFEQRLKLSNQILEAAATGGLFPDAIQHQCNLEILWQAVRTYAGAHDGKLPPDLGSLLEFIPADQKRLATLRDRARVFLSPHAAANTFIPDQPDAEWVNRNTSYVYLGSDSALLDQIDDRTMALIHLKLDLPLGAGLDGKPDTRIPLQTAGNGYSAGPRDYVETVARDAREFFDAVRAGRELPDRYHALRDLRYLFAAVRAYAQAHDGKLPRDLGDTLQFLPDDEYSRENAANIYLSPRAQRSRGEMTEPPDADWVRRHATYVYLGSDRWTLKEFQRNWTSVLIHGPWSESLPVPGPFTTYEGVSVVSPSGHRWLCGREVMDEQLAEMRAAP